MESDKTDAVVVVVVEGGAVVAEASEAGEVSSKRTKVVSANMNNGCTAANQAGAAVAAALALAVVLGPSSGASLPVWSATIIKMLDARMALTLSAKWGYLTRATRIKADLSTLGVIQRAVVLLLLLLLPVAVAEAAAVEA